MTTRTNRWPGGKVPRQPVKPSKEIPVEQTGWFQHAADWKKAEMLASENGGSRRNRK